MSEPLNLFDKIFEQEKLPYQHKEGVMNRVGGYNCGAISYIRLSPIRFELMGQQKENFGLKSKLDKEK